jgi:Ca2+-binding EF-hand superfamily protein
MYSNHENYIPVLIERKQAFAKMGKSMSDEEINIFFERYDMDGGGKLELGEIRHMVKSTMKTPCQPGCNCCNVLTPDNQAQTGAKNVI